MKLITIIISLFLFQVQAQAQPKKKLIEQLFTELNMQKEVDNEILHGIDLVIQSNMTLIGMRAELQGFALDKFGWKSLKDEVIAKYDTHFTKKDLKEMISFFKTKSGKKFQKLHPKLTMEVAYLAQQKARTHLPGFIKSLAERRPASENADDRPILEKMNE